MNNVEERLRGQTIHALAGADYVREKLLALLNTGPENIASKVYAIKCRVKDEESLMRKVLFKRSVEKKNPYNPTTVTDIVGLRLLALNNEQLPIIVEKFIEFIRFCQLPSVGLFEGHVPGQAITEIKVYKSQNNPVVYDEIYSYLMALNLRDHRRMPEIELRQSTKEDPYSSVHFVCRANSYYSKVPKPIPVEVQIRTVFEDAWAEIDHPLRYKGGAYLSKSQSRAYKDLKKSADNFLGGLKEYVDHCLHLTDDIQNLYSQISRTFGRQTKVSTIRYTPSGARLDYSHAFFKVTPKPIRDEIAKVDRAIQKLSRNLLAFRLYKRNLTTLNKIINGLDRINDAYLAHYSGLYNRDRPFAYYFKMEKAFLLMWKNRVLNLRSADMLEVQRNNKAALELYLEMDRDPQYTEDAILKFRLASALSIAGSDDLAQQKLRQAVNALKQDSRIPSHHLLRVTIPRQYAFMLWQRKQEIWQLGAKTSDFKYRVVEQNTILAECRKYAKECLRRLRQIEKSPDKEVEELRAWNNYISYVWELNDLGITPGTIEADDAQRMRSMLPLMDRKRREYTRRLSGLDTALKWAHLIDDEAKIRKYAKLMRAEIKVIYRARSRFMEYTEEELLYIQYCLGRVEGSKLPKKRVLN